MSPRRLAAVAGVAILRQPRLGLLALIVAALAAPFPIGTGTEVQLNLAALLTPALFGLWLLGAAVQGRLRLAPSPVNLPLVLFLLAGLLSLGIGLVTWDPLVPRRPSFLLVQLAQWAIFAFSALAFWLTSLLARDRALAAADDRRLSGGGGRAGAAARDSPLVSALSWHYDRGGGSGALLAAAQCAGGWAVALQSAAAPTGATGVSRCSC
jgi:hypothetical protein